ncbi:MAG TPA: 4Fe-4S ferredoxin [Treponema sp.]|nr:4Fe-4S ferredoxin [Treponema sp.]
MKAARFRRLRHFTLIVSMLLFPVTIWYFSPYLIIMAALRHIINGSFITFTLMFVLGMFFGRLWCGFFCPTGGMSECFESFSPKTPRQGWRNSIKYAVWALWLSGVIVCHVLGKGDYSVQPFFMTDHGISVSNIYAYVIYYGIVLLFLIPALVHGKRANCHYICWMAPFMILGYKAGRALHLPQLRIQADTARCTGCGACHKVCPMGLDARSCSQGGEIRNAECILCGECAAACRNDVLRYTIAASGTPRIPHKG